MSKVRITETVLRDAHQSLIATRMPTEQMLPIVEQLDNIGYNALEAWGGATFDASLRFLNDVALLKERKLQIAYVIGGAKGYIVILRGIGVRKTDARRLVQNQLLIHIGHPGKAELC